MMISHASLPAREPARVARVIAELLSGEALPFPPGGPDAWIVWSRDGAIELQVVPRGAVMAPGDDGATVVPVEAPRAGSETHVALDVDRPAAELLAIARREGWRCGVYERGGHFRSTEVWLEDAFLLELFDPEQAAGYRAFMTPASWRRAFGL
jgi:hypothetical protein